MKSNKNNFKKGEKGLAIETAQERNQPFRENLDGTSFVNDAIKVNPEKTKVETVRTRRRKR